MSPPSTANRPAVQTHSRALSLRLTDEQHNHLVTQAHLRGHTLAEAARQAIERDIDAQPDFGHEDGSPGVSMRYRGFLAIADLTAALEELAPE